MLSLGTNENLFNSIIIIYVLYIVSLPDTDIQSKITMNEIQSQKCVALVSSINHNDLVILLFFLWKKYSLGACLITNMSK